MSMLLHELIQINESALVANAVSFDLMDDPDKNLRLCQGFVFNYDSDPTKLKSSTVGVLDALRRSFHSPNEPNIHLMVQDYGKGKSHFALAVANFFKQPYDSLEVQGVLQQIEYATSKDNSVLEGLRLYKQRGRHLVICLSGDKTIDLKKHFLQVLRKALDSEGIVDTIAQQLCQAPLQYLESLNGEERAIAEAYLENKGNPEGDLNSLIKLLKDDNYQVILRVKEICRELVGVTPDFEADIDVEAILTDLITRLCQGVDAPFQGILILFDELYNYLQLWAGDPVRAGSSTLQNITNICEKYKGKIALMSFTQRRPNTVTPPKNAEDYHRLVSRLELLQTLYEPAASLELVLDSLLDQQINSSAYQSFQSKWVNTLTALNTETYQNRTANYYQSRNWPLQKFLTHITLGCFPLHPLTSYLLCNLDFTQGRTAIQFVQENVKDFILKEPVEKNDKLNLIYPVALVDAFEDNFATSDYSSYSAYKHGYDSIVASATLEELLVLKALFLFYASASARKLKKLDQEKHEVILSLLTGMPEVKVKEILQKKLCHEREVIYHNLADNTYRFYSGGIGIQDLRKLIEEEVASITPSIETVTSYCQSNLLHFFGGDTITPMKFVEDNRLIETDWLFKREVYTVASFRRTLTNHLNVSDKAGTIAYIIAGTKEELATLKSEINQLLTSSSKAPTQRRIAVAIAAQPATDIAKLLLMLSNTERKNVQEFGAALTQLQQQLKQQIDGKINELFKSCIYHCSVLDKVPIGDRASPSRVASVILQELYPFVPPVEKVDKMALNSTKGGEIIGYVSKRLLEDDLRPQTFPGKSYDNLIEPVLVKSWRILRNNSQKYTIQVPTQPKVKAAWEKISEMTDLGERVEKTVEIAQIWKALSEPPYGYNEYSFTLLFASWLAFHRLEVRLKGNDGIPQKKSEQFVMRDEPPKKWANTNVFNKPKDFVHSWVLKEKPQLIRRKPLPCPEVPKSVDYDQAQQFIQEINHFLTGAPEPTQAHEIEKTLQQLIDGVTRIDKLLEPVSQAESLLKTNVSQQKVDIKTLIQLYPKLQQPLSPEIEESGLSVNPTEQQEVRRFQVAQAVIERMGHAIEAKRSQPLPTEAECNTYKAEIQHLIAQMHQVSELPTRFISTLQDAIRAVDSKIAEIAEQKRVEDCLSQVQRLFSSLSTLATQADYTRVQAEIEQLVTGVPVAKENEIYRSVVENLKEKQDALTRRVADWENQFSSAMPRDRAWELSLEISQQLNRFTDEANRQTLDDLLSRLQPIIVVEPEEQSEQKPNPEMVPKNSQQPQQDLENQIVSLFQQLPAKQRQRLLKKLTKYAVSETSEEDANG